MIYEYKNKTCSISSYGVWICGLYENKKTANYAFRFSPQELSELKEKVFSDKTNINSVITFEMLQQKYKERKK